MLDVTPSHIGIVICAVVLVAALGLERANRRVDAQEQQRERTPLAAAEARLRLSLGVLATALGAIAALLALIGLIAAQAAVSGGWDGFALFNMAVACFLLLFSLSRLSKVRNEIVHHRARIRDLA